MRLAARSDVVARAARTALLVGAILIAINHGDALLSGDVGPVEALYKERKYEEAIQAADKLVAAKQVDPANEYWAGRALRVLKRYDEAAERFRALSRRFPQATEAPNSDIDAEISLLGKMPKGEHSDKDRKYAAGIGQRLHGSQLCRGEEQAQQIFPLAEIEGLRRGGHAAAAAQPPAVQRDSSALLGHRKTFMRKRPFGHTQTTHIAGQEAALC